MSNHTYDATAHAQFLKAIADYFSAFGIPSIRDAARAFLAEQAKRESEPGWIEWKGGECPLRNARVQVKLRNGEIDEDHNPARYMWSHTGDIFDIISYRVIKEKPQPPPAVTVSEEAVRVGRQAWQDSRNLSAIDGVRYILESVTPIIAADLAAENARLKRNLGELTQTNESAWANIRELERQLNRMQKRLAKYENSEKPNEPTV